MTKTYAPASHYCNQCDRDGIIIDGICASCTYDNRVNAFSLYQAAVKADDAFQAALVEAYGKDAGDMRYSYVLPSSIALLRIAKREADEAYLKTFKHNA